MGLHRLIERDCLINHRLDLARIEQRPYMVAQLATIAALNDIERGREVEPVTVKRRRRS